MVQLAVVRPLVPSASRVDTPHEVDCYKTLVTRLWNRRTGQFPGCHPRSLSRAALPCLAKGSYLAALKSDGVRYTLVLTMRPQGGPVALMVDRAWSMYEVVVVAPEEFFVRNTLIEGELVWAQPGEERMLFLVFDAVVIAGRSMVSETFETRMSSISKLTNLSEEIGQLDSDEEIDTKSVETNTIVFAHVTPPILMRPKVFVSLMHASRLWNDRREVDHRVDGIVVQCATARYVHGTPKELHGSSYKWKSHSTVDLAFDRVPTTMNGPLPETIHGRRVVFKPSNITPDAEGVIEYLIELGPQDLFLMAVRTRPDKERPNTLRVVEATVNDVIEAVTLDELSECGRTAMEADAPVQAP